MDALKEMLLEDGEAFFEGTGIAPYVSPEEYVRILINRSKGRSLPEGWVPATTYWLLVDDIIVGQINIRHSLTEHLRNVGGHVGYWIRPSQRRKGYGTTMLNLALQKAKAMGLKHVLISCDTTNIGSKKIIEANGGVRERVQGMGNDHPEKLLYWIELQ